MDTVQVAVTSENSGKRREGTITKIISRGTTRIVCTYEKSKTFGFAVPDNPKFGSDIFIPQERSKGAVSGHKVVVEITDYGKEGRKPEGKVIEIIGHINDPGTDIMSIVKAYDLPVEFSEKIMHQVENVSNDVSTADMAGRMDFRDWQTVTIDGEDAKDLDDAITFSEMSLAESVIIIIFPIIHKTPFFANEQTHENALRAASACFIRCH
mgnify:CR=1 FL=1